MNVDQFDIQLAVLKANGVDTDDIENEAAILALDLEELGLTAADLLDVEKLDDSAIYELFGTKPDVYFLIQAIDNFEMPDELAIAKKILA